MKYIFSIIFYCQLFLCSCNLGSKKHKNSDVQQFCLDVFKTQAKNKIMIGKGFLTLNGDKTFIIKNDSLKFSNITGEWELSGSSSATKYFIFKPKNHIRQMSKLPEFEVKSEGKTIYLIFTFCE